MFRELAEATQQAPQQLIKPKPVKVQRKPRQAYFSPFSSYALTPSRFSVDNGF